MNFPINFNINFIFNLLSKMGLPEFGAKKHNFIYKRFFKRLAIYENGHGIAVNSIEVEVIKSLSRIRRGFDAKSGNGCKDTSLPKFTDMRSVNEKKRFVDNGFWIKSRPECQIEIEEDHDDRKVFYFVFNPPLKKGQVLRLSYAVSVKCMFPIRNGIFDPSIACNPNEALGKANFEVKHFIEDFEYEIAFRGVQPKQLPIMEIQQEDGNRVETINPKVYFDPFYDRYRFSLKKPKVGYTISIQWLWKTK